MPGWHDGDYWMSNDEKELLSRIIRGWMKGELKCAKTYTYKAIKALDVLERGDIKA